VDETIPTANALKNQPLSAVVEETGIVPRGTVVEGENKAKSEVLDDGNPRVTKGRKHD
jgi:hypothetical protein